MSSWRRPGSRHRTWSKSRSCMRNAYVYIMASKRNGTLYIGVTSNLAKRVYEHRHDVADGFTKKYKTHRLVYFETHEDIREAIVREKQLKNWQRLWKIRLIESVNPGWEDLCAMVLGEQPSDFV